MINPPGEWLAFHQGRDEKLALQHRVKGVRVGRNAPFNTRFLPIIYGFPEGFR